MKILVGSFQCESNTFAPNKANRDSFHILYGNDVTSKLAACRVFESAGCEIVPMVYAVSLPSGKVDRDAYLGILGEFLDIASHNKNADGVYLYFHGAMFVEGIGSGEEYFVSRLREIIGDDIPISIASDFHSNVSDGLVSQINAMTGYRTAPHTDYDETEYRAAITLLRIINEKLTVKPVIFRIKVLLADAAQTDVEPYRTLIGMLNKADDNPDVVSAALYNGQPWVDAPYVGASIVLFDCGCNGTAEHLGKEMADYFETHKNEFCFMIPALSPQKTVEEVSSSVKPLFISDSGDNTTAGADGKSTFLLQKFIGRNSERTLFACICNCIAYDCLKTHKDGDKIDLYVPAEDINSEPITIDGYVVCHGDILGFVGELIGKGVCFRTGMTDIIFTNVRTSFIKEEHFKSMHISVKDYDVIVLKMGYLWPGVSILAKSSIFSMTPGTSTNDFSSLDYKKLNGEYFYIK